MSHTPIEIKLSRQLRVLTVCFDDGTRFDLPCEYLRVHSPSAEVRGHGKRQEVLQTNKEQVNIEEIKQVGNYAVKLVFDDQHDSGIYSWNLLYDLGKNRATLWQQYLDQLSSNNITRRPQASDALLSDNANE